MFALFFRRLINWSLLLRHVLAVGCLVIGARQLLLIRDAQLLEYTKRYGLQAGSRKYFALDATRSWSEQVSDLYMRDPLAMLLACFAGVSLSWLIVNERRERRAIPLLVLLIDLLSVRLGLYESKAAYVMTHGLHQLLRLPLVPRMWVVGSLWTILGLLLLLSTWPFRRAARIQAAVV